MEQSFPRSGMNDTIPVIRPLAEADWLRLRDLRLHALRTEPGVFFASYEREAALEQTEWIARITDPGKRVFGLFADAELIAITGIITSPGDPSGATAELVMSYILPPYRGRGFSSLLFEARLRWATAQPQITTVRVSHRYSNQASRRAIERHGFVFVRRAPRLWPDGVLEDEVFYQLSLIR
jgi:RimJ/RimL family protein N-acetyltransferase